MEKSAISSISPDCWRLNLGKTEGWGGTDEEKKNRGRGPGILFIRVYCTRFELRETESIFNFTSIWGIYLTNVSKTNEVMAVWELRTEWPLCRELFFLKYSQGKRGQSGFAKLKKCGFVVQSDFLANKLNLGKAQTIIKRNIKWNYSGKWYCQVGMESLIWSW